MAARARRTALIAASVPEETKRTFSIDGTGLTTRSASSTSALHGAPNDVPAAGRGARPRRPRLRQWPKMSGPYDMT